MKKELIYIGDPMCSWCWGFSPVLQGLRKQFHEHLAFSVVVGGLRPGTKETMTDDVKQYIRHHWTEVNKMTGQPFSFDFFNRHDFIYDSEPPCRAVVTVRNLKPDTAFNYFESLHHSFYAENDDITATEVLSKNALKHGVAQEAFEKAFSSRKIIDETSDDFGAARSMGVRGFPSLVLKDGERNIPVSRGYQDLQTLSSKLEVLLNLK